jgi:hypothetical protein
VPDAAVGDAVAVRVLVAVAVVPTGVCDGVTEGCPNPVGLAVGVADGCPVVVATAVMVLVAVEVAVRCGGGLEFTCITIGRKANSQRGSSPEQSPVSGVLDGVPGPGVQAVRVAVGPVGVDSRVPVGVDVTDRGVHVTVGVGGTWST